MGEDDILEEWRIVPKFEEWEKPYLKNYRIMQQKDGTGEGVFIVQRRRFWVMWERIEYPTYHDGLAEQLEHPTIDLAFREIRENIRAQAKQKKSLFQVWS